MSLEGPKSGLGHLKHGRPTARNYPLSVTVPWVSIYYDAEILPLETTTEFCSINSLRVEFELPMLEARVRGKTHTRAPRMEDQI